MISIIIPTLNEISTIKQTLERLRMIDGVQYEIIISDGGSSDGTIELARLLADRVIVHDGKLRQTIADGRNLGASIAKGEYLLFLDADVHLEGAEVFLKTLIQRFENNNKLVAATVRIKVLPEATTLTDKLLSTIMIDWPHYLNNNILKTGSSSGEVQFMRKSAFVQVGGFDGSLVSCEDVNMFERLAKIGQTKMFYDLAVYHSGRRFHKIGWFKVLLTWQINIFYYKFRGKAKSKVWTEVR
jgi:glycosyltransferase involved in cell wall biosynthesis